MIQFEHEGVTILNPFISSCGRFEVDPAEYGFEEQETVSGGRALVKMLDNGDYIALTNQDKTGVPVENETPKMTVYRHCQEIGSCDAPSSEEMIEFFNMRFVAYWGSSFAAKDASKVEPVVVDCAFFTEENGYTLAEQIEIFRLKHKQVWQSPDFIDHLVMRVDI